MKSPAVLLLVFGYLAIFALCIFIPLQTDEVNWQFVNHRAVVDHFKMMTLFPQCELPQTFLKDVPISWYPYVLVNYLVHMQVEGLLWIRIIGLLYFALFLFVSWFITKPLAERLNINPQTIYILFLSIIALDEIPILLQVNRPEQGVLLSICTFIALALNAEKINTKTRRITAISIFIFTALMLYPAHPKAVVTLPIMLLCGGILFFRITSSRIFTVTSLGLLSTFAVYSAIFWLQRFDCPLATDTAKIISDNGPSLKNAINDPSAFVRDSLERFAMATLMDFNIHLHILHTKNWLVTSVTETPLWLSSFSSILADIIIGLRITIFFTAMITFAALIIRPRNLKSRYVALSATLILTVLALMIFSGLARAFYYATLQVPLIIIAVFLFLPLLRINKLSVKTLNLIKIVLVVIACVNIALIISRYYPYISNPELGNNKIFHRLINQAAIGYESKAAEIQKVYSECGLPPLNEAQHLIVDDTTYSALRHSQMPFSFDYVTNLFLRHSSYYTNAPLFDLLERYNSSGVFLSCNLTPPKLKPYLKQKGSYCCGDTNYILKK